MNDTKVCNTKVFKDYDIKFNEDFQYGKFGEDTIKLLLGGYKTIEVKRDRMAHRTGNITIECAYKSACGTVFESSGIEATKAEYYAYLIEGFGDTIIIIKTERLKIICKQCKIYFGGDGRRSKFYLVPIMKLFENTSHL